jgi:hypothetical protein
VVPVEPVVPPLELPPEFDAAATAPTTATDASSVSPTVTAPTTGVLKLRGSSASTALLIKASKLAANRFFISNSFSTSTLYKT